jgi:hypothetical protein
MNVGLGQCVPPTRTGMADRDEQRADDPAR